MQVSKLQTLLHCDSSMQGCIHYNVKSLILEQVQYQQMGLDIWICTIKNRILPCNVYIAE